MRVEGIACKIDNPRSRDSRVYISLPVLLFYTHSELVVRFKVSQIARGKSKETRGRIEGGSCGQ